MQPTTDHNNIFSIRYYTTLGPYTTTDIIIIQKIEGKEREREERAIEMYIKILDTKIGHSLILM